MNRYSLVTAVLFVMFAAGVSLHFIRQSRSQDFQKETTALAAIFSEAKSFSKKTGSPPHYKAYNAGAGTGEDILSGLAFLTTDVRPEIYGYAGPIKIMVGMNLDGSIKDLRVISHAETPSYVTGLDAFLGQFRAKGIKDPFRRGEDIDGITRASITSEAIARSVGQSLKQVAGDVLGLEVSRTASAVKPFPLDEVIVPLLLFGLAVAGVLSYNSKIRWAALLGGFLYFGVLKSTMVSTVHIANLFLLKFPSFGQSPLWYTLVGLTLITTPVWGMVYCGSLCPFAPVQELLYNGCNRKKNKKPDLSYAADYRARMTKYILLLLAVTVSIVLGNASAASIEPFLTLFTQNAGGLGWALLILMLAAATRHFRFWCKYLCPAGAFLGLIADKSPFKIKLAGDCAGCNICERSCPTRALRMDEKKLPVITYPECILCGKCVTKCPKDSLRMKQ